VPIVLAVITPNPATVSGFPGQTTPSINLSLTWAATASGGGTATIVVAGQPAGVTTVPATVTYAYAGGSTSASTSFQFAIGATTPPGTYPVTLRDTSVNAAGSGTVTLIVNNPTFNATATPNPVTLAIGGAAQNVTVNTTFDPGFSARQIDYTFSGFPNFINTGGTQTSFGPNYPPVTFTFSLGAGAVAGTYNGTLTGSYTDPFTGALVSKTFPYQVIVQQTDIAASFSNPAVNLCQGGPAAPNAINLSPLNGYSGTPQLSFTSVPAGITITPATPTAAAMPPGQSIPFTISASSTATPGTQIVVLNVSDPAANINKNINLTVTVTAPDYTPSTSPSSVNLTAGGGGQSITASITPNACFTASVSVAPTAPPGITFSPPSGTAPTTFVVQAASNVAPGTYTATFTFTPSSGTTKTTTVTITVAAAPDFRLNVSPPSVSVTPGLSASVTVSGTGVNGFAGSVFVTSPTLPNVTFSPLTFTLVPGGSQVVTITPSPNATPATQTGVFTGTAAGIAGARTAPITVTIAPGPDFSLSVVPPSVSVAAGQSTFIGVTVTGLNGFTGSVTVTAPSSPDLRFTPDSFTIAAGGSQTVQVTASSTATPSTFTGAFSGTAIGVAGARTAPVVITITAALISRSMCRHPR